MLQNVVFQWHLDVLQSRKTASTLTGKPNAFLIILGAILRFRLEMIQIRQVL